jgi:replicative DNA helicase
MKIVNEIAENSLLGCLFANPDKAATIFGILTPEDFYLPQNKMIANAIAAIVKRGNLPDVAAIEVEMGEFAQEIDTRQFDLLAAQQWVEEPEHYVPLVKDASLNRRFAELCDQNYQSIMKGRDRQELIDTLQQELAGLSATFAERHSIPVKDVIAKLNLEQDRKPLAGLETGLLDLDKMIAGFHAGEMAIIAGRPGAGKTTLALNISEKVAVSGIPVLFYSLEMAQEAVAISLVASHAEVPLYKIRGGTTSQEERVKLVLAGSKISAMPIYFYAGAGSTIQELINLVTADIVRFKFGLVIVDYVGLLQVGKEKIRVESKQQEVAAISARLKGLAIKLGIPLIAISQLSRAIEMRADSTPKLSDLRDSGALEQDADLVLIIHRNKEKAIIHVAKQRFGQTGKVEVRFFGNKLKFVSVSSESPPEASRAGEPDGLVHNQEDSLKFMDGSQMKSYPPSKKTKGISRVNFPEEIERDTNNFLADDTVPF